jgi:hypothetical protein
LLNNYEQQTADENKSEADRILKMIKTNNDPDKAATNLQFLVDAGLITNPKTKEPLVTYLKNRKQGEGVTLPAATTSTSTSTIALPRPTFSIECTLPLDATVREVSSSVEDFLRAPPFSLSQIEISDVGQNRYISWDISKPRNFSDLSLFSSAIIADMLAPLDSIKIAPGDGQLKVSAVLPQSAGRFGIRHVDQDAVFKDFVDRMRQISNAARCGRGALSGWDLLGPGVGDAPTTSSPTSDTRPVTTK